MKRFTQRIVRGAAVLAALALAAPAAQADLIGLWQFDDASNVGEASVGSNLASSGDAAQGGGQAGGGLDLDGSGDFLGGATALPTGDSSYTIAAWIRADVTGNRGIAGFGDFGTPNEVTAFRTLGANGFRHYWWADDQDVGDAGVDLDGGPWVHVAATYDGSTQRVFVNGGEVGSRTPTNAGAHASTAANFRIGSTNFGEFFDGQLDDVAIFDEALGSAQLKTIAKGDFSAYTLAHRYSFTSDATDSVGNADLTLQGGASIAGGKLDTSDANGGSRNDGAFASGAALTELSNTITSASAITIESWFNQDGLNNWAKLFMAGNDTGNYMDITPHRGVAAPNTDLFSASINDATHNENRVVASPALGVDTEYYVAAIWNPQSDEMTITFGEVGGTLSTFVATMGGNLLSGLTIGEFYLGSAVGFGDPDWDGQIDEFRIWTAALSQSQIASNFAAGPDAIGQTIPAPAALPAGLAMIVALAARRRRAR